jgi:hypothetical protein
MTIDDHDEGSEAGSAPSAEASLQAAPIGSDGAGGPALQRDLQTAERESADVAADASLKVAEISAREAEEDVGAPGSADEEQLLLDERERMLAELGRPQSPEDYELTSPHPSITPDPKLNARLHEAGFTTEQAQLVYDLAAEILLPTIAEISDELRAERELDKLKGSVGGQQQWVLISEQLRTWATASLDANTYAALSSTAEGVQAMMQIMKTREPQPITGSAGDADILDEAALHSMMRDPRYWRRRDPEFIARVTAGFERLFGR